MKRRLSALVPEWIQLFGLLIAFIVFVAGKGFAVANPVLAAILLFVFSAAYLVASIASKRAHFLYGTMLIGAVSYFLTCHALGAPGASFPLFAVPLVLCLLIVGHRLLRKLPAEMKSFPATVFNAMNITVAVFAIWALSQAGELLRGPGVLRYVAGATLLGFAGLYLAHSILGAHTLYIYVFSMLLTLGAILLGIAIWSMSMCWIPALVAAAAILLLGTCLHNRKSYRWSRHLYLSAAVAIFIALIFSAFNFSTLLFGLALSSVILWIAHSTMAGECGKLSSMSAAERSVGRCMFLVSMALGLPIVPVLFVRPANINVGFTALIYGLLFGWISWKRSRERVAGRNIYIIPAFFFISGGLCGLWWLVAASISPMLSLAAPVALFAALLLLHKISGASGEPAISKSIAEAAIFPTFFAWFVPLIMHQQTTALVNAAAAVLGVIVLAAALKNPLYLYGLGLGISGAAVAFILMYAGIDHSSWKLYACGALWAGICFAVFDGAKKDVARGAANLAWLVFSIAAAVTAATLSIKAVLYCSVVIGFISVLLSSRKKEKRPDVFEFMIKAVALFSTIAVLVLGPFSGVSTLQAGVCTLVLAAAYCLGWGTSRSTGMIWFGLALFAMGAVHIVFGLLPAIDLRAVTGAAIPLVLYLFGALLLRKLPSVASGSIVVGHLTSIALACAIFIQSWGMGRSYLPLAAAIFVVIYALMPSLRQNKGFRLSAVCWLSVFILFALVNGADTPYRQHIPAVAVLSLLWLMVGYGLQKTKFKDWSVSLYVGATILAIFCGAVSLFGPPVPGSWLVFLINGVVYAVLFLLLKKDIFAYLVTLSLLLLTFQWVKASTTSFTQELFFYLVLAAFFLVALYLMPYLKKLIDRIGLLPIFSIFTWKGAALLAIPLFLCAIVVVSAYSVKITAHPRFCTSCHYMGEYYKSWQHSSHKDVECVKCHYEPGFTAGVKGKMEGMVQLIKYLSHSYTSKPHALIGNASCMRSSCHSKMDSNKETLLFRGKVRFRHDVHLEKHPRGKVLNCVSCHGQVVQGKHISVTETTCVTCHFYGRGDRPVAVGDCQTCHLIPDHTVTFMGQPFNHKAFLKGNSSVECIHCHSQVTQGDGLVAPVRCQTCHLDTTAEIKDQSQFHLVHVSKGHFDCLQCHNEIKHGVLPMEAQMLTSSNCQSCHGGERHSLQERIYAGTAVSEIENMPDVMYKAGVACDGCHTDVQYVDSGEMTFTCKVSGEKQCARCHGEDSYAEILTMWQSDIRERLSAVQKELKQLETARNSDEAKSLLKSVRVLVSSVVDDGSYGAHNNEYISAILDKAEAELAQCRSLPGRVSKGVTR